METSQVYPSCAYAVLSPCGTYIASLSRSQDHIYVQWTQSLFPAYTFTLQNQSPLLPTETRTLKWTSDSGHLMLVSPQDVRLFSLKDTAVKRHVSNGSGGFGKIIAAEVVGDYLVVAWEFGTLQQWHIETGKCCECGEVRIDEQGQPLWALRDTDRSIKVFVTLAMSSGQESLSFRLAAQPTAFKLLSTKSVDTRCMSWSRDGQWLATLDSELASQSAHIYTPDGHLFRSYPPTDMRSSLEAAPQTGFTTMRWSHKVLAMSSAKRPITLLDGRTLSHRHTLSTRSRSDLGGWQEDLTSKETRSYKFVTQPSIPAAAIVECASNMEFNMNGSLLAAWNTEQTVHGLTIWDMEVLIPCAVLVTKIPVRTVIWHPVNWDRVAILCQDGSLRLWSLSSAEAPTFMPCPVRSTAEVTRSQVSWIVSTSSPDSASARQQEHETQQRESHDSILVTDRKVGWTLIWPNGKPPVKAPVLVAEEDVTQQEDSLYDILSGKKPLPSLALPKVDEGTTMAVEDTFEMVKHRAAPRVSTGSSEMF